MPCFVSKSSATFSSGYDVTTQEIEVFFTETVLVGQAHPTKRGHSEGPGGCPRRRLCRDTALLLAMRCLRCGLTRRWSPQRCRGTDGVGDVAAVGLAKTPLVSGVATSVITREAPFLGTISSLGSPFCCIMEVVIPHGPAPCAGLSLLLKDGFPQKPGERKYILKKLEARKTTRETLEGKLTKECPPVSLLRLVYFQVKSFQDKFVSEELTANGAVRFNPPAGRPLPAVRLAGASRRQGRL